MIRRLSVSLLLFAPCACGGDRHTSASAATSPPSATAVATRDSSAANQPAPGEPSRIIPDSVADAEPPVSPLPPAPAYLVWTADSSHAAVTVWIDSTGRAVAQRPGMYAADGARLWRWEEGEAPSPGLDCECLYDHPGRGCRVTKPVGWAGLAEVGGRARVPLLELPDTSQQRGEKPPTQHAYPVVGVGRYLFYHTDFDGSACGAHGWWGTARELADLHAGSLVTTDTVRIVARDSAAGQDALVASDEGDDDEGVKDGSLDTVEARWKGDDTLSLFLRFSVGAAFGLGDGDGYRRTILTPATHAPRWLAPYLSTPRAVRRYWRTSPRREHAGWSPVDAAHATALLARFRRG